MNRLPICAYPTDPIEQQGLDPIIMALRRRGLEMAIDRTMARPSEVGLFLGHQEGNLPELARCPIIMLHDLGQAHNVWPHFWSKEGWGDYAWGLLPNEQWMRMAQAYPHRSRLPRNGVLNLGWPKSDAAFREMQRLGGRPSGPVNGRLTVLYAPSWEFDGQQDKFLNALADLPINILVKQQFYEGSGHNQRVAEMAARHRGRWKNVYLLEPVTKIFDVLRIADCIVSDESSTMVEGAMVGCVPVAVMDWKIPDTEPPRHPSVPFEYVNKVQMKELRGFISSMTDPQVLQRYRNKLASNTDYVPMHQGQAGDVFADFIADCLASIAVTELPLPELQSA